MVLLAHSVVLAVFQNQEVLLLRQYDEEADLVCCEILFLAEELNLKDPEVYVWVRGCSDTMTSRQDGLRYRSTTKELFPLTKRGLLLHQ